MTYTTKSQAFSNSIVVRQDPGGRPAMEDRYSVLEKPGIGLFIGVYDGHGGAQVADILVHTFGECFFQALAEKGNPILAFRRAYQMVDSLTSDFDEGATSVTIFLTGNELTFAHVGDCSLFVVGRTTRRLNVAHRLDNENERARILTAGGHIMDPYFVHHGKGLMTTRAFGDRSMRAAGLKAVPDIGTYRLATDDRYALLATDGICDVAAASTIHQMLHDHLSSPERAAEALMRHALSHSGADNMTVILAAVQK